MDRNLEIMNKLAKLNQKWFREDELQKMDISLDERNNLFQKGFFKIDREQSRMLGLPVFLLTDSAYMFVVAKETEKSSEATRKLTKWLLAFTFFLIILTVFQIAILIYDQFLR
jgi:hypothetical protein